MTGVASKQAVSHRCNEFLINFRNMLSYIKVGIQTKELENRILRRIFDPKYDKNGELRRIHIANSLYR